jgi:hypothetical protein
MRSQRVVRRCRRRIDGNLVKRTIEFVRPWWDDELEGMNGWAGEHAYGVSY